MKITRVEALHCDGGWRPWTFVRGETDDGLVGWGECSDNRSPHGIAGCVRDFTDLLVGQDPRPIERLYWDMLRRVRGEPGKVHRGRLAGDDHVGLERGEAARHHLAPQRSDVPMRARVVPQCDQ